jgi:hypothetical protein
LIVDTLADNPMIVDTLADNAKCQLSIRYVTHFHLMIQVIL